MIVLAVVQHPGLPVQVEKPAYLPGYGFWIGSELFADDLHALDAVRRERALSTALFPELLVLSPEVLLGTTGEAS